MPRRILRTIAVAVACLLGALGTVVVGLSSGALVAIVIATTTAGVAVTAQVHEAGPRDAAAPRHGSRVSAAVRAGTTAAVKTAGALLVAAGIVGLLGTTSAYVILPLLAAAGLRAWWRHDSDRRNLAAGPVALPPPVVAAPRIDPAAMSVPQLCRAWDRSCWLLREMPAGSARITMVGSREHLLDELERRDPAGFHRWIHSGASARNDPGRYLT